MQSPRPTRLAALLALLAAIAPAAHAAAAQVPGLEAATLRPGWVTPDGTRMTALELVLAPGWKTYWRSPGDGGMVPEFDWSASTNLGAAVPSWPAPEVIDSGGYRSFGYHDRLLLPIEITPATPGQPVAPRLTLDFGICREVCVPAEVTLAAPPPGTAPAPEIEAALAAVPVPASAQPQCRVTPIADGLALALQLPRTPDAPVAPPEAAAIELIGPDGPLPVWVSAVTLAPDAAGLSASAEVLPDAEGFTLDPASVRLTLLGLPDGQGGRAAVRYDGCLAD